MARPEARSACAALLVLAGAQVAQAQSVPERVHLREPSCAELPFVPARLRSLLALELLADGAELVELEGAGAVVAYEPDPCEAGSTRFVLRVNRADGTSSSHIADASEIPLATVPRALALELAEALRGTLVSVSPAIPEETEPQEPASEPSPPAPAPTAVATRLGAGASFRGTPDTDAALIGARLFVDLPLGRDLPLALRVDTTLAFGPSAHGLTLGALTGGLTLSIAARALHVLGVRFGPRLSIGHAWAIDANEGASRVSEDVMVAVGLSAGVDLALGEGVELLLEGEAGTHLVGLEYLTPGGRSGLVGASWGLDLAFAFAL